MRPRGRRLALAPVAILFLLVFSSSLIPPFAHAQFSKDDRAGSPTSSAFGSILVPHQSTSTATPSARSTAKPTTKPLPVGGGGGAVTSSAVASKTVPSSPTSIPPVVAKRCKDCLSASSGSTCYQNTQCVPLVLLCNNSTNLCVDGLGVPPSSSPVSCQANQLCYADSYLPLPDSVDSMDQNVQRNSSSNCLPGSYFSLFGYTPATSSQSVVRYTESCAGVGYSQVAYSSPPTCQAWEYQVENACFLKTCNDGLAMSCEAPFECKKLLSANGYGLCWNPNSTVPDPSNDGEGYQDTAEDRKERLIQGLLIGICSLILIVGVGLGLWHYRKKRAKRMAAMRDGLDPNGGRRHPAYTGGERSTDTKEGLWQRLTCCSRRRKTLSDPDAQQDDDGSHNGLQPSSTPESHEMRVVSLTESEGNESSLLVGSDHSRSHMIFARRWRWGGGVAGHPTLSGQEGGVGPVMNTVMPEIGPPPLYHHGEDLPVYRDRNTAGMSLASEQPLDLGSSAAVVTLDQELQQQPEQESGSVTAASHEQDQSHPLQLPDQTPQPPALAPSNLIGAQQLQPSATNATSQDHTQV